jgi:hypothetical protein
MIRKSIPAWLFLPLAGGAASVIIWVALWQRHDGVGLVRCLDIVAEHWHGKLVSQIISNVMHGSAEQQIEALSELSGVYYEGSGLSWDDNGPRGPALSMMESDMEKMGVSQRGRTIAECAATCLGSNNASVRRMALCVLTRIGPERAVVDDKLRGVAEVEEDESVLLGLMWLFHRVGINEKEQVLGNVRLLRSPNDDVVLGAAIRLGNMRQRARLAVPELEAARRFRSIDVRDACSRALQAIR